MELSWQDRQRMLCTAAVPVVIPEAEMVVPSQVVYVADVTGLAHR
jgi:hypothetical protein